MRYVYEDGQRGILNLDAADAPRAPNPQLVSKVVEILSKGDPDSQAVVLPLLAALPSDSPWGRQPEVLTSLRGLLEQQPRPANYASVLNAASSFQTLMREPAMREQILAGLNDKSTEVQRAAVRVCSNISWETRRPRLWSRPPLPT